MQLVADVPAVLIDEYLFDAPMFAGEGACLGISRLEIRQAKSVAGDVRSEIKQGPENREAVGPAAEQEGYGLVGQIPLNYLPKDGSQLFHFVLHRIWSRIVEAMWDIITGGTARPRRSHCWE